VAGRYRALLIGNSTYPADEHNLQTLKGPVKDIAALHHALIDPCSGLFADLDVTLLPEATSTRAIRALGKFFREAARDDVLLIYFSGHGKLDQSGRLHLCMQDTDSTDLLSTAVSSVRINEFAGASHARNVVIVLDCCHAGAFRGGELGDAVAGPGRYVLTSCRETQLANDATVENGTSFFTQHLVDGLVEAAADQDGDGYVTFSELYAYVDRRLREGGKQIPQRRVDGDGDLRLARRPQPAPAEVTPTGEATPVLEVSPSRLDLGEIPPGHIAELRVSNRGGGDLEWTYDTAAEFYHLERTQLGLLFRFGHQAGHHEGHLVIHSNGGQADVSVTATIRHGQPKGPPVGGPPPVAPDVAGDGTVDAALAAGGPRPTRTRRKMLAAAAAALAIAIAGVITALYFPNGSRPIWPYDTGSAVYTQPAIVNGVVYLGNTNGYVYALDADTGIVRWQFPQAGKPAIGSVYSSPVVAGKMVYVGSDDGRIYALKDTTGVPAWSRPCHTPGDRVRSNPVFVDGVVYATSGTGYVCAMRAASGAPYWKPVWIGPGALGSSPTVAPPTPGTGLNGISIYVGSGDGHVYALNAGSGAKRWMFPPKGQPGVGIIDSPPTMSADGSAVYAASSGTGGHLYALAADTGKIQWEYPPKNRPGIGTIDSPPAVASDGSAVYVASGFDVYALSASSGTLLGTWKHDPVQLPSTIDTAGPELGTVAIYVGNGKHVYCLNATTGALCWLPPFTADSRVVSTPAVNGNNGTIYFGALDGKVYALTPTGALVCAANGRSCGS
jgi:outer membrane protein assembly factor BamB